jgi:hypothetical protein
MTDFVLSESELKVGMLIIYIRRTGCYHFEDDKGNRFLFNCKSGVTDDRQFAGKQTVFSFGKIANKFAIEAGLKIKWLRLRSDEPGTIRYKFVEPYPGSFYLLF